MRWLRVLRAGSQLVRRSCSLHTSTPSFSMDLSNVVQALETVAPTAVAEPWDNVGLLVEPSSPQPIQRLLITNDLTEEVLTEATRTSESGHRTGLIVSYHPPIFKPFKRLTQKSAKERIVVSVLEQGMAVYAPHTALDNMAGGINDWLLSAVGEGQADALALQKHSCSHPNILQLRGPEEQWEPVQALLSQQSGVVGLVQSSSSEMTAECTDEAIASLCPKLSCFSHVSLSVSSNPKFVPTLSGGKLLTLQQPTPLSEIIKQLKSHLKLPHLRLAHPANVEGEFLVRTAAACAGSGGSVLQGVRADLLLTGEMSHHQVLDATSRGCAVILCEHSNTERGFLQTVYRTQLEKALNGKVDVAISVVDRDPLEIV